MATRTVTTIVDDLDGMSNADETVVFALDGISYSIDLTSGNAQKLRDDLAQWVSHATQTGGRRARKAAKSSTKRSATEVRDWGRANGYTVSERGRVSRELQEAFDKAH